MIALCGCLLLNDEETEKEKRKYTFLSLTACGKWHESSTQLSNNTVWKEVFVSVFRQLHCHAYATASVCCYIEGGVAYVISQSEQCFPGILINILTYINI